MLTIGIDKTRANGVLIMGVADMIRTNLQRLFIVELVTEVLYSLRLITAALAEVVLKQHVLMRMDLKAVQNAHLVIKEIQTTCPSASRKAVQHLNL